MTHRLKLVVYTRGWVQDEPMKPGEDPMAQVECRVFANDVEIERVIGVNVKTEGGDFLEATIRVAPSTVDFVPCTEEEWRSL